MPDPWSSRCRHVRHRGREVTIDEDLWDQGPAIVNAEIKKRLAGELAAIENVPADNPPFGAQRPSSAADAILAAWQPDDQPPQRGVQHISVSGKAIASSRSSEPTPPIEAIPEQEPIATRFAVNAQGLIDVVPDPPAHGTADDALQREIYDETREKAAILMGYGHNQLGDLADPVTRFRESLPARIEEVSISRAWSRANTLRCRLDAHDLAMEKVERDPALLPPLVAGALRDLVQTWNVFIVGDPKGRELDAKRPGPAELDAIKRVLTIAAPIVEAVRHSENVATPAAIEAIVENNLAAKEAPAGIHGDQAKDLSRNTTANFVAEVLKGALTGFIRKAGADAYDLAKVMAVPAIISFVINNAEALKEFALVAWHNPTVVEIINAIVRNCIGF
jgi:hypothetical protein